MASDDNALALAAGKGDRDAFQLLVERHYDRLFALACRFTGSASQAEDIVQDICCALPGKLKSYRGRSRFTTWLYKVALNACRDQARRHAAARAREQAYGEFARLDLAEKAERAQRLEWLRHALGRLDEQLAATAVLVTGEGMTHAEAASALGVAENTVSWRMHQVRKKLTGMAEDER